MRRLWGFEGDGAFRETQAAGHRQSPDLTWDTLRLAACLFILPPFGLEWLCLLI